MPTATHSQSSQLGYMVWLRVAGWRGTVLVGRLAGYSPLPPCCCRVPAVLGATCTASCFSNCATDRHSPGGLGCIPSWGELGRALLGTRLGPSTEVCPRWSLIAGWA